MSETAPRPNDPLRDAWQATRQLEGDPAPSAQVRARILAEARRGRAHTLGDDLARRRNAAANDARWRIPAIASMTVLGLAALLAWELRHGTPGEPEPAEVASAPAAPVQAPQGDGPAGRAARETRAQPPRTATEPAQASDVLRSRVPRQADRDPHREQAASAGDGMPERALPAPAPAPAPSTAPSTVAPAQAAKAGTAAAAPARSLVAAAETGNLDGIRQSLADGTAIDAPDARGNTPLIAAIRAGHIAAVRLLLEAGADPNRTDGNAITPLQHAQARADAAVADLLVAAGAR